MIRRCRFVKSAISTTVILMSSSLSAARQSILLGWGTSAGFSITCTRLVTQHFVYHMIRSGNPKQWTLHSSPLFGRADFFQQTQNDPTSPSLENTTPRAKIRPRAEFWD